MSGNDDFSMLANRYINMARTPISAEDFCGHDVRYSAEFEALEAELAKADCLHVTTGPDWETIREGSESLLLQQSKDLRAAVWLAWSLYQSASFSGLQAGIAALVYLCTHHWEELHPRKARTRQAVFGWLLPRLEHALTAKPEESGSVDPATVNALANQLRQLDQCLIAHMAAEAPLLLPLCRRMDELAAQKVHCDTPATPTTQKLAAASVTPSQYQPTSSHTKIHTGRDAHKAMRALQEPVRSLCDWWLDQSVTDPRAIRLSRTLLWLPIASLPEHDHQQQTALRGPSADRLVGYAEQLAREQYTELLRELESSVAKSPFWLDGQRMICECLEALSAADALRELEEQVRLFLARLPGLEQLRFHDGVAFADDRTQTWLTIMTQAAIGGCGEPMPNAVQSVEQAPWEEALTTAAALMRKQNLKVAIRLLKQGMHAAPNERERFHWQLAQARLCHQGRHYELASYQLEALCKTLQDANLDRWEPELAIRTLRLLADSYDRLPRKHGSPERKNAIHQRLCHLDLEAALDQTPGS